MLYSLAELDIKIQLEIALTLGAHQPNWMKHSNFFHFPHAPMDALLFVRGKTRKTFLRDLQHKGWLMTQERKREHCRGGRNVGWRYIDKL